MPDNKRSLQEEFDIDCAILEDYFYSGLTLEEAGNRNKVRDAYARKEKYIKYKNQKGAYKRGHYCGIQVRGRETGEESKMTLDMLNSYLDKVAKEYPNITTLIDDYLEDYYDIEIVVDKAGKTVSDAKSKTIRVINTSMEEVSDVDSETFYTCTPRGDRVGGIEEHKYSSGSTHHFAAWFRVLILMLIAGFLLHGAWKWIDGRTGPKTYDEALMEHQEEKEKGAGSLKRFNYKKNTYYGTKTFTGKPDWFCFMVNKDRGVSQHSFGLIDYNTDYGVLTYMSEIRVGETVGKGIKGRGIVKDTTGIKVGKFVSGKLSGVGCNYTGDTLELVEFKGDKIVKKLAVCNDGVWELLVDIKAVITGSHIKYKEVSVIKDGTIYRVDSGDISVKISNKDNLTLTRDGLSVGIEGEDLWLDDMYEIEDGIHLGRRLEYSGKGLSDVIKEESGSEILTYTASCEFSY